MPQTAPKAALTRDQGARGPCQARAPFFFQHVVGVNGTAAHAGSYGPLFSQHVWGGYAPANLLISCTPA